MKPVTDPALLATLDAEPTARKPVTDAALLAQLDAPIGVNEMTADGVEHFVRGVNKALVGFVTAPYRAIDWVGEKITGGDFLPNAEDMPAYKPFLKQPEAATVAGRYAGSVGEAVGGSAIPSGVAMHAASKIPTVAPALPGLVDRFLRPIAQNPRQATAWDAGASTASGVAQQSAAEEGAGPGTQMIAGTAGGFVPSVAATTVPRLAGAAFDLLPKIRASADGGIPPRAAQDAATQMIADQMLRAGVTVDQLRQRLATGEWARTLHTSGKVQDATALADLDESLARLLGSAVRQQPEAANIARGFLHARQTGMDPDVELPTTAGIPTRQPMSKDVDIAGQHDRIVDGLKRALRIKDTDFHGHAGNANRTDQQIAEAAKRESTPAYNAAYAAGNGVDVQPHLQPVLQKWSAIAAPDGNEPDRVANVLNRIIKRFSRVSNLTQFDKNKQFILDAEIDRLFKSTEGRNRYFGGRLTELKNDLLAAVDAIPDNNVGPLYRDARDIFSSHAEARRVLKMGRDAYNAEGDVGVDAFNSLTSKGDQKLFRLGILGAHEAKSASMPAGADRTRMFDTPRMQQLLANVIERTETPTGRVKIADGAPAEFSDRPQRFGAFIGEEGKYARTRNIVQGGSPTAERLADDQAFDTLHTFLEIFKNPNLVSIGKRGLEYALNKTMGMRPDTAAAIAHQLLAANPATRQMILDNIASQMGRDRFARMSQILEQHQRSVTGATAGSAGGMQGLSQPSPDDDIGGLQVGDPGGRMRLGGPPLNGDSGAPQFDDGGDLSSPAFRRLPGERSPVPRGTALVGPGELEDPEAAAYGRRTQIPDVIRGARNVVETINTGIEDAGRAVVDTFNPVSIYERERAEMDRRAGQSVGQNVGEFALQAAVTAALSAATSPAGSNVISRAGQGIARAGQSIMQAMRGSPTVAKGVVGAGALGVGASSAGQPEGGSAAAGSKSIAEQLIDRVLGPEKGPAAGKYVADNATFAPQDRESFFAERRSKRQTLEEAQREASAAVEASQEYKDMLAERRTKAANNLVNQAMARAKARWTESQATIPQEEDRLQKQYSEHVQDMNSRRNEHYNKSWQDRAPTFATIVGAASWIIPFMLARRGFNKIAAEGETIIGKAEAARAANNARAEAQALIELDRWANRALPRQVWTATKAAAIPAEIRAGGEIWDKYFIPEGSGAQKRATEKLGKTFGSMHGFAEEMGPSIMSGLASTATAGLTSRPTPKNAAAGELSTLRNVGEPREGLFPWSGPRASNPAQSMSPDEIASTILARRPTPTTPQGQAAAQAAAANADDRFKVRARDKNGRLYWYDSRNGFKTSPPAPPEP